MNAPALTAQSLRDFAYLDELTTGEIRHLGKVLETGLARLQKEDPEGFDAEGVYPLLPSWASEADWKALDAALGGLAHPEIVVCLRQGYSEGWLVSVMARDRRPRLDAPGRFVPLADIKCINRHAAARISDRLTRELHGLG